MAKLPAHARPREIVCQKCAEGTISMTARAVSAGIHYTDAALLWESYDLVFSKMLCEHLPDARTFHANCLRLLRPGARAVHFFPTLYTLPFVANRLIPEGF